MKTKMQYMLGWRADGKGKYHRVSVFPQNEYIIYNKRKAISALKRCMEFNPEWEYKLFQRPIGEWEEVKMK